MICMKIELQLIGFNFQGISICLLKMSKQESKATIYDFTSNK